VLRLIETRAGSLLIGGRAVRYSNLRGEERDAYLQHWVQHRIPLIRSAASALRKLLCFLACMRMQTIQAIQGSVHA